MGGSYSIENETEEARAEVRKAADDNAAETTGPSDAINKMPLKMDEARPSMKGDFRGAGVYTSYYVTT
ncbi:MAG: hypothetical protein V3S89_04930 [Desulfobacterales bacterium]